jgi:RND family efflux transporter MFP subunit
MATSHPVQQPGNRGRKRRLTLRRALLLLVVIGAVAATLWYRWGRATSGPSNTATFTVTRGPMEITVLEGGSAEARESRQIKCEVQGATKILKIVDEGYLVTQAEVDKGLVLIELDSKQLVDLQVNQELEYQNAMAAVTSAREAYEIQLNQNESELKTANLAIQLNRMDLEKYLGEELAGRIVTEIESSRKTQQAKQHEEREAEQAAKDAAKAAAAASGTPLEDKPLDEKAASEAGENVAAIAGITDMAPSINLLDQAKPDDLGDGDARQRMRALENDLVLSQQDVALAATVLEGTKRLFEKDFVTKNKLDNDQLAYNRKQIAQQTATTSKELFLKYEFPKSAQKQASQYEDALRKMERAGKVAISQLATAEAARNSAEVRYGVQARKRKELAEQIQKCTVKATYTGMVVYGTGEHNWHSEPIEEGANVREQQVMLTIPDASAMAVKVQVHESFVQKIKPGQKARIRLDSNPGALLTGEVHRISVLPDSQNRWMNPDLKVYATIIYIDGNNEWLKPGMSAEAEIIVDKLEDVVQVPLQAVTLENNQQVCYVSTALGHERRVVETADYNTAMIVVTKGVNPGEKVLLRSPNTSGKETPDSPSTEGKGDKEKQPDEKGKAGDAPKEGKGA